MNYLSLVLRNLTRNKRRTILTIFSITVSIFIFASLISLPGLLNQVLRDRANSAASSLTARPASSTCCPNPTGAGSKLCPTSRQ